MIINGYGKTSTLTEEDLEIPNHSWNAVKLNNRWYLCDPTWASGIQNAETLNFRFDYNDGYFLVPPELFAINHHPLDTKWLLLKEERSIDDFINAPFLYGSSYKFLEVHKSPKTLEQTIKRGETVTFSYTLKQSVIKDDIHFIIDNGYREKRVTPKIITITNKELVIEQPFSTRGFYDVHMYFGTDLIATYTVTVKR